MRLTGTNWVSKQGISADIPIKGGAAFGFFGNSINRNLYKKYGNAVEVAEEEKG